MDVNDWKLRRLTRKRLVDVPAESQEKMKSDTSGPNSNEREDVLKHG